MKNLLMIVAASLMLYFASCTKGDLNVSQQTPTKIDTLLHAPAGCGVLKKIDIIQAPSGTQPYEWINGMPVFYYHIFTVDYSGKVIPFKMMLSELNNQNYAVGQQFCR